MYFTISYILKAVFLKLLLFFLALGAIGFVLRLILNFFYETDEFATMVMEPENPHPGWRNYHPDNMIVKFLLILAVAGLVAYHMAGIPTGKETARMKGTEYNAVERTTVTAYNQIKYSLIVRIYNNLEESIVDDKLSDLELLRKRTEINDEKEIHKLRYLEKREKKLIKRKESLKEYFRLAKKS